MSTDSHEESNVLPAAATIKKKRFSSIWLLPILALAIGGWILTKTVINAPIEITILFDNGVGIIPGKTPVKYNGIDIGMVKELSVDWDKNGEGVIADVNIDHGFAKVLRKDTEFWLVKPEVSLKQVTGLDTLITGNYIAMKFKMGKSDDTRSFVAKAKAPDEIEKGSLPVVLEASSAFSIIAGDSILYKGITIGRVLSVKLSNTANMILIKASIEPEYVRLVRKNSVFWNNSGVNFHFGLFSGAEFKTESLESILQGGIVMATPETNMGEQVKWNHHFPLHNEADSDWKGWSPKIKIH